MTLATLFVHPIVVPWDLQLWLLLPLLAAVAIIYKAVRTHHVRRLGIEAGFTFLYMVGGILALSVVLWLLTEYWP
jgi:hypothetical protein